MNRVMILWLITPLLWASPNSMEETMLTDQLSTPLRQGKLMRMESSGQPFVAVLQQARPVETSGLAILLPEAGLRVDAGFLQELARVLPAHGWSTLSVQLPVLESEAGTDDYLELLPDSRQRLGVALARMKAVGMKNIALIGHGFGALAVLNYAYLHADESIHALVLLSPWWPQQKQEDLADWLFKTKLPVLDIRAERDRSRILTTADERYQLLKSLAGFRQWRISGAGHHYRGQEEALAKRIYGWLKTVTAGE